MAAKGTDQEIKLTKEDLTEAKKIINDLIKDDKNKYMLNALGESLLSTASNVTGKFSAQNLYFLSGNIGLNSVSGATSSYMEMIQYAAMSRIAAKTDHMLHDDFNARSRSERLGMNSDKIYQYSSTLRQSAGQYMFRQGKLMGSTLTSAASIGIIGIGLASNPVVAASVVGGAVLASVPQRALFQRLKRVRVKYKNMIDECQKALDATNQQSYRNSLMVETANAQAVAKKELQRKQEALIKKVQAFSKEVKKNTIMSYALTGLCVGGALAASVAMGLPLASTVAVTAGVTGTMAGISNMLNAYYGKKEFIETFAMTYKKFKSKYKDFQFGNENVKQNANMLQLENVAYKHRSREDATFGIVSDITQFKSNETITFGPGISILSGASGAGKSTLTELMLHMDNVSDGSIKIGTIGENGRFEGQDYRNLKSCAPCQNIAVSYQSPEMMELTVGEYIRLGNPNASEEKVAEIKNLLKIGDGKNGTIDENRMLSSSSNLSGGEKNRLGLAQALIKDSPIMILDEPTSGVDETMSKNIVDYLKSQKDKTIIYITHDPKEISSTGAYQAVDIGRHSAEDTVNMVKSYDLTDSKVKEEYINLFQNREAVQNQVAKINTQEMSSDLRKRISERMHERITDEKPITPRDLREFKEQKGVDREQAAKETKALFGKIYQYKNQKNTL